ncbi:MAG: DUF4333 domain-containing protein [Agrococcus casei]|uniref:DUF4333 domain-containing protein n=1 Tax=Agrococcus casei TaxID=343512 RepID=UPI003F91E5C8
MTQQPPYGSGHDPRYGSPFGPPPGAPQPRPGFASPPPSAPPASAPERRYAPPSAAPPSAAPPTHAPSPQGFYGPATPPPAMQQPSPEPQQKPKKSRRALAAALITGGAVAVIAVPLGMALGWFMQTNQYFDQAAVEAQVEQVLGEDYGLAEVSEVSCPAEVKPEQGTSFECTYVLNDSTQSVPVTVGSDDGQLLIGSPADEQ